MSDHPGARRRGFAILAERPHLALGLVRLLMVVALMTLLSASLTLQTVFDSLRANNMGAVTDVVTASRVELLLQQGLAAEREARLAPDAGALVAATGRFDRVSDAIGSRIRDFVAPPRSWAPALAASATALRRAVPLAMQALRGLIPARPGAGAGLGGQADGALIANASGAAERVSRDALAWRITFIDRIQRRERFGIAGSLAALTCFIVLLGGSATRLIEGRLILFAARRTATQQTQLLAGAVDHMRDGVAVFDVDDRLVLSNDRLGPVIGVAEALALHTPYAALAASLAHADPPLLGAPRPAIGTPVSGEMRVGKRVLAVYRSAMPAGFQMVTVSDVTERVAAEEMVRRAQRMEALGRLTGGVAHDFNNLLQALSANLEVMSAETSGLPGRMSALTAQALGAVDRGSRLTRHLLAFARRQELAAVPLDTAAILLGLRDLLDRTLGDEIAVELSIEKGLWPVLADAAGLENALLNLALNGRDAMAQGGRLSMTARNDMSSGPDGDRVVIEVVDGGIGMTEDQIARAVEPFYTTKAVGAGVGLGLSLVDGFARQSGGQFRLESEPGRGTRAILLLPRAPSAVASAPPVPIAAPGRGETILLVEDDPVVSRATREALEQLGYRVVGAADARSACRLLEDGVRPDLLFTDVMMPGPLDVGDLAARARALMPALPILFNTGDTEARVLATLRLDERMLVVAKPWRLAEISTRIRALLDREPALAVSEEA